MEIEARCPDCDIALHEVTLLPDGATTTDKLLIVTMEKGAWFAGCTRCEKIYKVRLTYGEGVFE